MHGAASDSYGQPRMFSFSPCSVQGQRTFFLTTSAETGKPSWILRRSISPKPKSWQKRIRDSHVGCKLGAGGRVRTVVFPLSGSVCLIALPVVSTESDSTSARRVKLEKSLGFLHFLSKGIRFVSQQEN